LHVVEGLMAAEVEVDRVIRTLAEANNRVVTRRALDAAGIGTNVIAHRVMTGRLYRHHHGVYLLDPPQLASRIALLTAAVEACGPGAALSHRSAAELWELLPAHKGHIEVTVVAHNAGDRPSIRRHRVAELHPRDIRTRHSVRVTSPARTVVDGASYLHGGELDEFVADAIAKGLTNARDIEAALARRPTRRGTRRLRAVLSQRGGPRRTRSWGERRLLALLRQAGLPVPLTNRLLLGFQVDALWPDLNLVVEVDGYEFHGDRASFETDRARDAALVAAGYRVIRFTATQLDEQPMLVIGQLAAALALASATNARTSVA
jgi:very-short-patch-repair endonuclease/predicted transcriptional regulator of viral defense system